MAIKYNVSYTENTEKKQILDKFKDEIKAGAKYKVVRGKPYNHIYILVKTD
ncbi:MAG: hypothetical protein PHY44_00795 [Lachnospiraceae bacterium]|nr:hypothetical protein [Lachnospiraceae bacterium]